MNYEHSPLGINHFSMKKPLTILVIPTLRLEFPNEIATSTKAVDPYLSQSASNFLAIFVGCMVSQV